MDVTFEPGAATPGSGDQRSAGGYAALVELGERAELGVGIVAVRYPCYVASAGFGWPGANDDARAFWAAVETELSSLPAEAEQSSLVMPLVAGTATVRFVRLADDQRLDQWALWWRKLPDFEAADSADSDWPYLDTIRAGALLVRSDATLLSWNRPLSDMLAGVELRVGARWPDLMPADMTAAIEEVLAEASRGESVDRLLATVTPSPRWYRARVVRMAGRDPETALIVVQLEDVTGSEAEQRRLVDQIVRDPLTGLFNRRALLDITELDDPSHSPFVGVAYLDIRRFKSVNELWGQFAADQCLIAMARWLRSAALLGDVAVRLSGDEFVVLCMDGSPLLSRVEEQRELAVQVGRQRIPVAMRAGWVDRLPGQSLFSACDQAERALAVAKRELWRDVVGWTPAISRAADERVELEESVRRAVAAREVTMLFQPLVNVVQARVDSFEALVRLTGAGEHIGAESIITASQQLGLTAYFAEMLFDLAFAGGRQLQTAYPGAAIAVNVSREFIGIGSAIDAVAGSAANTGLALESVIIEVTEELAGGVSGAELQAQLRYAVSLGMQVMVDDFGRGETSLSLLRSLPLAGIKLDRSLLPTDDDEDGWRFVAATVALLRTLTSKLIVEGVETPVQSRRLRDIGVHVQQGFLFGRPRPHGDWLSSARPRMSWPDP